MVTPELSQDALSACSHPSKPHVYCVGVSSCHLVSLGFLSCLLQETFQDCWKSRLKFPKDEDCAGYPTHPASVPPLVRPGPSAILSSNSAVLYIAGLLGVGILPKS